MTVDLDVALFGGGVAGLWTLNRLVSAGYRVALFEANRLGGVQSIASQGIIHGGAKYALAGRLTGSSEAIRDMPGIWLACLDGNGEIDLGQVKMRARHQLLWTQPGLAARLAGWLSSRIMQSRMARVRRTNLPQPFADSGFRGDLYRLEEPVLDTASLMAGLVHPVADRCFHYAFDDLQVPDAGNPGAFAVGGVAFRARRVVLTAGAGNAALLQRWGRDRPAMQRRPLQMVLAHGELPPVNGHWLGASRQLLLTITSAPMPNGGTVWYLGGGLSESGVGRSGTDQITAARETLAAALPWLELPALRWQTLSIDRAEPSTPDGSRPDGPFLDASDAVYCCWPTKLAFAPLLAQRVLDQLDQESIQPAHDAAPVSIDLARPGLAQPPWEVGQWN